MVRPDPSVNTPKVMIATITTKMTAVILRDTN